VVGDGRGGALYVAKNVPANHAARARDHYVVFGERHAPPMGRFPGLAKGARLALRGKRWPTGHELGMRSESACVRRDASTSGRVKGKDTSIQDGENHAPAPRNGCDDVMYREGGLSAASGNPCGKMIPSRRRARIDRVRWPVGMPTLGVRNGGKRSGCNPRQGVLAPKSANHGGGGPAGEEKPAFAKHRDAEDRWNCPSRRVAAIALWRRRTTAAGTTCAARRFNKWSRQPHHCLATRGDWLGDAIAHRGPCLCTGGIMPHD
jgi:hypothetical protein